MHFKITVCILYIQFCIIPPPILTPQSLCPPPPQVHKEDGPPLPLGEQLRGGAEPKVLRPLHLLHWADLVSQPLSWYSIRFDSIRYFNSHRAILLSQSWALAVFL